MKILEKLFSFTPKVSNTDVKTSKKENKRKFNNLFKVINNQTIKRLKDRCVKLFKNTQTLKGENEITSFEKLTKEINDNQVSIDFIRKDKKISQETKKSLKEFSQLKKDFKENEDFNAKLKLLKKIEHLQNNILSGFLKDNKEYLQTEYNNQNIKNDTKEFEIEGTNYKIEGQLYTDINRIDIIIGNDKLERNQDKEEMVHQFIKSCIGFGLNVEQIYTISKSTNQSSFAPMTGVLENNKIAQPTGESSLLLSLNKQADGKIRLDISKSSSKYKIQPEGVFTEPIENNLKTSYELSFIFDFEKKDSKPELVDVVYKKESCL